MLEAGRIVAERYRLVRQLGKGGMGEVWLAHHAGLDMPCAVKFIHAHVADAAQIRTRFEREARAVAQLRTANVVQVLDYGDWEGMPYIAMELLEGEDLGQRLERVGRLAPPATLALTHQIAKALAKAHAAGLVHRDLKPANVFLVDDEGRDLVKVLDFGVAKSTLPEAGGDTATGTLLGTPSYMSPEQARGNRAVDHRSDLWALAVVVFRCLTGVLPFRANALGELFVQIITEPIPSPSSVAPELPAAFDAWWSRATMRDPAARFQTAKELVDALAVALGLSGDGPPAHSEAGPFDPVSSAPPPAPAPGERASPTASSPALGARGASWGEDAALADTAQAIPKLAASTATSTGAPSATTRDPPAPAARPRRGYGAWIALGLTAFAAGGALALGLARTWMPPARHRVAATTAPAASAPAVASAAEAARPVSRDPAAAALYRGAMQAWHDASLTRAIRDLERAVALDQELGAAQLRLALWHFMAGSAGGKQVEGREHYEAAVLHRGTLSELDQGLVNAAEPYLGQPRDLDEWGKRLDDLTRRFPRDAELLVYLGASYQSRFQPDAAIAAYQRALAIDPSLLAARVAEAESLSMKGDPEGQLRVYQECLKASPMATECLFKQAALRAQVGDCAAMKDDAQRLLSLDPRSPEAQRQLALALSATGSPRDSVLEALGRSWALEADGDRGSVELQDRAALAAFSGAFADAERRLEEWQVAVADKPDQAAHATPAQRLAELFTEMGLPRKASDTADAFLRRMNAWTEPAGASSATLFLSYRLRAGAVSRADYEQSRSAALEAFRSKWLSAGRKLDDDFAWMAWSTAYGAEVATEDEARAAAEAMPKQRSKAMDGGRWQAMDLAVGRAYALSGSFADALPPLRRAASPCLALTDPVVRTWAQFYLGLALEGTGDAEGARAAYRTVVERWGKSSPRSITAEKARKRLSALAPRGRSPLASGANVPDGRSPYDSL